MTDRALCVACAAKSSIYLDSRLYSYSILRYGVPYPWQGIETIYLSRNARRVGFTHFTLNYHLHTLDLRWWWCQARNFSITQSQALRGEARAT